jgi:hypothetical protein
MDKTFGVWLRETREAAGKTLEDVASGTRIRPRFLVMLEDGDFAGFVGGELQIRGFLRCIARYLQLDPYDLLARYDAEVHPEEPEEPEESAIALAEAPVEVDRVRPAPARRPLSSLVAGYGRHRGTLGTALLWGAVAVVVIGVSAAIAYLAVQGGGGGSRVAAAVPPVEATLPVGATPGPQLATPAPTFAPDPEGGVTVALSASEHVWVRVTSDGHIAYVGFLSPQEAKSWSATESVLVETGNGAGIEVAVNDQPIGVMGPRGQAIARAWGPAGELEPA